MAEMPKTSRQPPAAATMPLAVRATRMPTSRPLITFPTTFPRSSSGASVLAIGTRICATTDVTPTTTRDIGDPAFYKLLTAVVVPRPIAWVSSRSAVGVDNLAPHSFFTVAAVDPPVVQFTSVGRKDSLNNVQATGEFVVNLAPRCCSSRSTPRARTSPRMRASSMPSGSSASRACV